jgi:hypothetical protein
MSGQRLAHIALGLGLGAYVTHLHGTTIETWTILLLAVGYGVVGSCASRKEKEQGK